MLHIAKKARAILRDTRTSIVNVVKSFVVMKCSNSGIDFHYFDDPVCLPGHGDMLGFHLNEDDQIVSVIINPSKGGPIYHNIEDESIINVYDLIIIMDQIEHELSYLQN